MELWHRPQNTGSAYLVRTQVCTPPFSPLTKEEEERASSNFVAWLHQEDELLQAKAACISGTRTSKVFALEDGDKTIVVKLVRLYLPETDGELDVAATYHYFSRESLSSELLGSHVWPCIPKACPR